MLWLLHPEFEERVPPPPHSSRHQPKQSAKRDKVELGLRKHNVGDRSAERSLVRSVRERCVTGHVILDLAHG